MQSVVDACGEGRIDAEAGVLKGGKTSATYRQDAKVAVRRVLSRHRGTPWAAIAGQMTALGTFEVEVVKYKLPEPPPPGTPSAPSTPGIQGDF